MSKRKKHIHKTSPQSKTIVLDEEDVFTDLVTIDNNIERLNIQKGLILDKGLSSMSPNTILSTKQYLTNKFVGDTRKKSYVVDPLDFSRGMDYKERPIQMSYNMLRAMSKAPIIKSIISTRTNQVASFSEFQDDSQRIGWSIRKKRKFFSKDKKTDQDFSDIELAEIEGLIKFIENAGVKEKKWSMDSFNSFLRKTTPDSLILDQDSFEIVRNRFGIPIEYFATDASTYRFSNSNNGGYVSKEEVEIDGYYPSTVQLYQGTVVAKFYPWELALGIRNPSTNIHNNGYGSSELEDMVKIVTWMLYADNYNGNFFSQGAHPKGLIAFEGNVGDDTLNEFRQNWKSQIAGVQNAWKTPVVNGNKFQYIDLQKSNQDMQFDSWQQYLLKIACAQYSITADEIGFSSAGQNTVYDANSDVKIKFSKEKGLHPFLKYRQNQINKYLVEPRTGGKYEFYFTGIEENLEDSTLENDIKKLSAGIISWKEIRGKYNLPSSISADDFILNPIWIQIKTMNQMGGALSNNAVDNIGGDSATNPFADSNNPFAKAGFNDEHSKESNPLLDFNKALVDEAKSKKEENPFVKDLLSHVNGLSSKN